MPRSRCASLSGTRRPCSDIKAFARRFGCAVRDSYGSTEGMIIIRRDPSMPDGALGSAADTVKVIDPDTMRECPPLAVGADGRSANLEEAVGEIVETAPSTGFEGYYKNPDATSTRFRNGWYWSGTSATGTTTAGSTSPGGRTNGSGSTARTSRRLRSR